MRMNDLRSAQPNRLQAKALAERYCAAAGSAGEDFIWFRSRYFVTPVHLTRQISADDLETGTHSAGVILYRGNGKHTS